METRRLGKTGHESSVITFGTFAIGKVGQDEADRAIEYALEQGINHFDVAPTYGEAELRLGSYLKRHPQPDLFISCKTNERGFDNARHELHRTLDRLGRDRFDLYQLHAVNDDKELEACFAPGGSLEAITEARADGLVTHVGITGHGLEAAKTHRAAIERFDGGQGFSTVMLAYNPYLATIPAFQADWDALLEVCAARDIGIHVLKAAAKGPWGEQAHRYQTWYEPLTDQTAIDSSVAWVLQTQPVTTLCSSGDLAILPMMVDAAARYREISPGTAEEIVAATPGYDNIFQAA